METQKGSIAWRRRKGATHGDAEREHHMGTQKGSNAWGRRKGATHGDAERACDCIVCLDMICSASELVSLFCEEVMVFLACLTENSF
eukprot:2312411-Pleurochrysis_carterae.AAC.1